jgi:hypothetical protein
MHRLALDRHRGHFTQWVFRRYLKEATGEAGRIRYRARGNNSPWGEETLIIFASLCHP